MDFYFKELTNGKLWYLNGRKIRPFFPCKTPITVNHLHLEVLCGGHKILATKSLVSSVQEP